MGLVARCPKGGKALWGFFFGPRRTSVPDLDQVLGLRAEDAVAPWVFGDHHLYYDKWPIIGDTPDWTRDGWPFPKYFSRVEPIWGISWLDRLDENNPARQLEEIHVPREEADRWPRHSGLGSGVVAYELNKLLPL